MVLRAEWCFRQLEIIGHDHQNFEINHVERVVGQESVEGFRVAALVVVPEQDREKTVDVFKALPRDAQLSLAAFEPAAITEATEHVAQVDMGLVECCT